jgi:hypothetical protein
MQNLILLIKSWIWLIVPISILMFVGTLAMIPVLLVRLPADYFTRHPITEWPTRHPLVHLLLVIGKNFLGAVLIGLGIVMLLLPGQGLLTILLGIILMDFPGKRKLERWLIHYQPLLKSANWLRHRYNKPPFRI